MQYVSFLSRSGRPAYGTTDGSVVREIVSEQAGNLISFLELAERERMAAIAASLSDPGTPFEQVDFLPVIPRPGKFICLGLNYAEHAKEGGFAVPDYPALFLRVTSSLVGHRHAIVRPQASEKLDYEAELAIVIGKRGRHIAAADAFEHVAGYTLFNDGSVRDFQRRTAQWTPGKNFDATGALGPVLVTRDELPAGAKGLHIESRLNGKVMQSSNTAEMIFDVATTIEIISTVMTLEPGDVIASGTPPGVGHARNPPVWMRHGDVCEIEIERIGILTNPIKDEPKLAVPAE